MEDRCITRNKKIIVAEVATDNQKYDFIEQNRLYVSVFPLWVSVKTKPFSSWFGVSNLEQGVTHVFNTLFFNDVFNFLGEEKVIISDFVSYSILGFENKDEKNKEINIYCSRRGAIEIADINFNEIENKTEN